MALKILTASPAMARELLTIYGPYVAHTAVTFEYDVPTADEFAARIESTLLRYPYLVAERDGVLAGYAYAGPFKARAAYNWSVETSLYVREGLQGQGVGKALYQALEGILIRQGITNVNACITWPNPASEAFHRAMGFHQAAHFTQCGFKGGQWHDMIWMEKHLGTHPNPPDDFIPFPLLGY